MSVCAVRMGCLPDKLLTSDDIMSPAKDVPRMSYDSARMLSRRTQIVWALFFVTISSAMLVLQLGSDGIQNGILLTNLSSVEERPSQDPVFSSLESTSQAHWSSIVITHLGQPAGSAQSVDRNHRNAGLDGLGYHFLIGNGNGLGDGNVHVGYRWLRQQASAKPAGVDSSWWSDQVISICLVGNGNRRPFTKLQLLYLTHLVQRLQQELSIPTSRIYLESEIGSDTSSPGEYFAEAQFRSQLLDIPTSN